MWRATVLTIFPEMFPGPLGASLAGKALAAGLWALEAADIRAHATDKHRSVDEALAGGPGAVVLCGRFEGVDQRLIEGRAFEEISVGDYVLSGGEIAAFVLLDACVRLLPGVMGKEASGAEESFAQGLLEYPHYTRPQLWEGRAIPEVLTSGDHAKVAAWRRAEAERLTRARRPDLWAKYRKPGGGGR